MRLNLGCGRRRLAGYVNVDKWPGCAPDLVCDLEQFPWPWADGAAEEIRLVHCLEHLCERRDDYLCLWQDIYRVTAPGGLVHIRVPHPLSDTYLGDPTHVRAITPVQMLLLSRRQCAEYRARDAANTPLAEILGVDFEMSNVQYVPAPAYVALGEAELRQLVGRQWNVIDEMRWDMRKVAPA